MSGLFFYYSNLLNKLFTIQTTTMADVWYCVKDKTRFSVLELTNKVHYLYDTLGHEIIKIKKRVNLLGTVNGTELIRLYAISCVQVDILLVG